MVDEVQVSSGEHVRPIRARGRQTGWMMLLGVLILACGVVIGAGGTLLRLRDRIVPPSKPTDSQEFVGKMVADSKEWLSLTPEQEVKVKAAYERLFSDMEAVRSQFRKLGEKHSEEMRQILTPEQFEKWKKRTEEWMRRGRGPGPGDRPQEGRGRQGREDGRGRQGRPDGRGPEGPGPFGPDAERQGPPPGAPPFPGPPPAGEAPTPGQSPTPPSETPSAAEPAKPDAAPQPETQPKP